jgi:hypothetical protein
VEKAKGFTKSSSAKKYIHHRGTEVTEREKTKKTYGLCFLILPGRCRQDQRPVSACGPLPQAERKTISLFFPFILCALCASVVHHVL